MIAIADRIVYLLIDTTVKASVLLAVTSVIAILSRRASASFRHLVWTLGLGCALVLPLLSSALPHWRVPFRTPVTQQRQAALSPSPAVAHLPDTATTQSATGAIQAASEPAPHISTKNGATPAAPTRPSLSQLTETAPFPWRALAFFIWVVGTVLALTRIVSGLVRARSVAAASTSVVDGPLSVVKTATMKTMGLRRPVTLLSSADTLRVTVPITWGALQPVIVLPSSAAQWPEEKLRSAMLHEMAHVRRHDWLLQTLAYLTCVLHWFNPLVWLAARKMRAESETACDDLVLGAGVPAREYARHLLDVAIHAQARSQIGVVAMAQTPKIESRLQTVLAQSSSRGSIGRHAIWGGVIAALLAALPLAALRVGASVRPTPIPGADHLQLQNGFTLTYATTVTDLRPQSALQDQYQQMHDQYQRLLRENPHYQPVPEEAIRPFSYFMSQRKKTRHLLITVSAEHGSLLYRSVEGANTYTWVYNGRGTQLYWNGHTGHTEPGLSFASMEDCPLPAVGLPYVALLKRATLVRGSGARQTWQAECPQEGVMGTNGRGISYEPCLAYVVHKDDFWMVQGINSLNQQLQFSQHRRFQGQWIAENWTFTRYSPPANMAASRPKNPLIFRSIEELQRDYDARRIATSTCEYRLVSASEKPLDPTSFDPIGVKRSAIQARYDAGIKRDLLHWPASWSVDAKSLHAKTQVQQLMVHDHTAQATVRQDDRVTVTDPKTGGHHLIESSATFYDFWTLGPKGWILDQGTPKGQSNMMDGKRRIELKD